MIKYGFQWGDLTVQVHSVRHDLPSAMASFSTDFNTVAPGTDLSGLLRRLPAAAPVNHRDCCRGLALRHHSLR